MNECRMKEEKGLNVKYLKGQKIFPSKLLEQKENKLSPCHKRVKGT